MEKTCYIISAGHCTGINFTKKEEDYVIAADGGYEYAMAYGIDVDMAIGDFDSLGYVPDGMNVIVHNPEKDDTDTMLAVIEGVKKGYADFVIYGALGGRISHTLANIQVLTYLAKRGMSGLIRDDDTNITVIKDGSISLPRREDGYFSVLCAGDIAFGVTIANAKYEAEGITMKNDNPLGVSNEFIGKPPIINVERGTLIIVWQDLT